MKISNHTDRLEACFGALKAVRMNCEAGFEAIDYSMYNAERSVFGKGGSLVAKEMRRIAESYGAHFNQTHAPFSRFKIGAENDAKNREIFNSIVRAIEVSAELGAPTIIVHPAVICPRLSADDRYEMNMEFYGNLLPRAKSLGVRIAIENMWGRHKDFPSRIVKDVCSDAAELIRYVDGAGDEYITACLDVGHSGLVGEAADEMALALGSRLTALHIHDNNFTEDTHTLPYFGNMNFGALTSALARIGYSGDVTLEADCFYRGLPDELVPAALSFSVAVAKHIRDEIERKKA
ncbi:MAG: sugar phosphate isomerase/epimerase [Clostridia bacterium]|nr:sugar phosphate isomerase/epimerase [Clostridia bacterium]